MLWLYREALRIRRRVNVASPGGFAWRDLGDGLVAFDRGDDFLSITNLTGRSVELPDNAGILLASSPLDRGLLAPDSTAWLSTRHERSRRTTNDPE
jgi:alpha-glucosidase